MGGNVRHAAKGPDRSQSTCAACETDFTHGKFSHPTYCESCREHRRDPDGIRTKVTAEMDTSLQTLSVTVRIVNENDVPHRDVPVSYDDESRACVVGYLRVEGDDGQCAAETGWVEDFTYKQLKLRAEHAREMTFTWEPGSKGDDDNEGGVFRQESVSASESNRDAFDVFLEEVGMVQGSPFDADELGVVFIPAVECPELDQASVTVSVPSFLVDL